MQDKNGKIANVYIFGKPNSIKGYSLFTLEVLRMKCIEMVNDV